MMQKTLSHLRQRNPLEMRTLRFDSRIHLSKRNRAVIECPYWSLRDRRGYGKRGFYGNYLCLKEILDADLIISMFGLCLGSSRSSYLNFTCVYSMPRGYLMS